MSDFYTIKKQPCNYCGSTIKENGIDRVDSNKGYTTVNCVPCCTMCNTMKWTMGRIQFYQQVKRIYKHLDL